MTSDSTLFHLDTTSVLLGNHKCYGVEDDPGDARLQTLVDMVDEDGPKTRSNKREKKHVSNL